MSLEPSRLDKAANTRKSASSLAFITRFFAAESAGGLILMASALAALLLANSPWSAAYFSTLQV